MRLILFGIRRSGWEMRISPNGVSRPQSSSEILLKDDGIYGIEDTSDHPWPSLSFEADSSLLQPLRFYENVEYDFSLLMPITAAQYAQRVWSTRNSLYPFDDQVLMHVLTMNGLDSASPLPGNGGFRITGRLKFASRVGAVDFVFESHEIDFSAEVMSSKIGYEDDFMHLIDDLAYKHSELMLHLDGPTTRQLQINSTRRPSPMVEVLHFRRLMRDEHLPSALATITHNPAFKFNNNDQKELSAFVTSPEMVELASNPMNLDWSRGGPLRNLFRGFTPQTLPTRTTYRNLDIVENRFVKQCLSFFIQRLDQLQTSFPSSGYEASRNSVKLWREELASVLAHPMWSDIGSSSEFPFTVLMQTRNGYKEFGEAYLSFDLGISLESALGELNAQGGLKPVYDLYELWCYFQLHECLSNITGGEGSPQLAYLFKNQQFSVGIQSGSHPVVFTYRIDNQDVELSLFYIRRFPKISAGQAGEAFGYSTSFDPDFSIQITSASGTHWIHFDAKYKLEASDWDEELGLYAPADDKFSSKRADLLTMHAYRDGILGARASFILYPGGAESHRVFVRHTDPNYRRTFNFPSVGAFPLRPGQRRAEQLQRLQEFMQSLIEQIHGADGYTEEGASAQNTI